MKRLGSIVLLVRHGETPWNKKQLLQGRTNIPLCENGREQARILSSALATVPVSSIYSSPLSRALETAQILSLPYKASPIADDGFVEIDFGEWEGKSHEALRKEVPRQYEKWLINPKEVAVTRAERLDDAKTRVMRSYERIMKESEGKVVIIVGHGGINRILLLSLLQADLAAFWRIRQDSTCVNLVEFVDGMPRVNVVNCTTHFKTDYAQIVKVAMERTRVSTENQD